MFDAITAATGFATAVAELFDWRSLAAQPLDLLVFVLAAAAFFSTKRKKLFVVALVLTLLAAAFAKDFINEPRPCQLVPSLASNPDCPSDPGFPSSHAAVATVFALAAIGSRFFYLFLAAAIIVAWSRVYLGVHSLTQVIGGIALGAVVYFLLVQASDAVQKLQRSKTQEKAAKKIKKKARAEK